MTHFAADESNEAGAAEGIAGARSLRIAIAIATAGRPQILANMLDSLRTQSRPADAIFVCAPSVDDVADVPLAELGAELVIGPHGSCVQRNAIINRAHGFDIIVFFDDDFIPRSDYLAQTAELFVQRSDVVIATGHVIADGAVGPGYDSAEAKEILRKDALRGEVARKICPVYSGYGCNMSIRAAVLREHAVTFDETLPLYGWLEDVDFSRRLAPYGSIVKSASMRGVHLGTKSGRQPGKRVGYSQVANPLYLARKGTLSWPRALRQLGRNVTANLIGACWSEIYIDRRGRAIGNALAFADFIRGKLDPRRILSINPSHKAAR